MKILWTAFAFGLLLTPGLLFSAASNPRITWSPGQLVKEPIIGTSSSQQITFTSDTALSNVVVEVVPELRQFVKVFPASIATIPANVSQTITVAFDVPEITSPDPVSGTIRLVSGSGPPRTYARPLPVSIEPREPSTELLPDTISLPSVDRMLRNGAGSIVFVRNEIVVEFLAETSLDQVKIVAEEIGGTFIGRYPPANLYQIAVTGADLESLNAIADSVLQNPLVIRASPHYFVTPFESTTSLFDIQEPNDPLSINSWVIPFLRLGQAWEVTTGRKSYEEPGGVRDLGIAIIDSDFDADHRDLAPNVTFAYPNVQTFLQSLWFEQNPQSHGTAVSSIVGAVGNNGIGITGVMWDASLHLFPTANSDVFIRQSVSDILANPNIRVVNSSFGDECIHEVCDSEGESYLQKMSDRWRDDVESESGEQKVWVFAAGNKGRHIRNTSYREIADKPNVIVVGAVDSEGERSHWVDPPGTSSNYGSSVAVYAPGGNIPALGWYFLGLPAPFKGTSGAAPFVTGVAGLMLSVNPSLTPPEVKNIIKCTARPTGNHDPDGNEIKVLDAYQAVKAASTGNFCAGNITINAKLDGQNFSGNLNFSIAGPNAVEYGETVPRSTVGPYGQYTLTHNGGGPPNSVITGITPANTQMLGPGQDITFTINFSTIPCAPKPSNMVAWWRGEGNAQDSIATNHGTLVNGAGFTSGKVGQGFSLNGSGQFINIPHAASLNPQFELTTETWIKLDQLPPAHPNGAGWLIVGKDNPQAGPYALGVNSDGAVGFGTYILGPGWKGVYSPPGSVVPGQYSHIAGTYSSSSQQFCVYVNGQATCSSIGCCLRNTTNPVKFGANLAWGLYSKGIIDEVSIYDRALNSTEIQAIHSAGSSGKCTE